jgi:hypothetical protein
MRIRKNNRTLDERYQDMWSYAKKYKGSSQMCRGIETSTGVKSLALAGPDIKRYVEAMYKNEYIAKEGYRTVRKPMPPALKCQLTSKNELYILA